MTVDALIILTGGLIVALPFLGFPQSWDSVLYFFAGIIVIALGIIVRRGSVRPANPKKPAMRPRQSYVESTPVAKEEESHEEE